MALFFAGCCFLGSTGAVPKHAMRLAAASASLAARTAAGTSVPNLEARARALSAADDSELALLLPSRAGSRVELAESQSRKVELWNSRIVG